MSLPHEQADWPYIQNGATSLFLSQKVLDDAERILRGIGYHVIKVDCATDNSLLRDLSKGLNWKEQFGYEPKQLGLDALNDAVGCEPFEGSTKTLVIFSRFEGFWNRDKQRAFRVLDIFENNARHYLLHGKRLLIFVKVSDPAFHIEGLGGVSAQWNPKEWFHKDRGL